MSLFDVIEAHTDIHDHIGRFLDVAYESLAIIECGVRSGNSTQVFLHGLAALDGHLWSVDPEPVTPPLPAHPRWTFIQGDDLDPAVLKRLPTNVDVVFLDSSVGFEHKVKELEEYVPRLASGGVLFVHDTEAPFVARALSEFERNTGIGWTNDPASHGLAIIQR